jgi:hypothetical protein
MNETPTSLINEALRTIHAQRPGNSVAVVLIGSVARDSAMADSDLDLLVLASPRLEVPRTPDRLHIQSMDERVFAERLKEGDDFAAWCIRFGVPISTSTFWLDITASPESTSWPDWRKKIPHVCRRLILAHSLAQSGDLPAATEESLYAVTHLGRTVLLKENVFPLSRPEMIQQLQDSGHRALAALIKSLLFEEPKAGTVRRTIRYTKRLLLVLDREGYREFITARKEREAARRREHPVAEKKRKR